MTYDQQQTLDNLVNTQRNLGQGWVNYWRSYMLASWQFWVSLILLVIPLIILYFVIDRKKAFRIGFFGFNVHVWFGYIDDFGVTWGLWTYPYKIFPFISVNVPLEASLVPVTYMLMYQWTLNRHRNYYLYGTILSAVFAFVLKPIMVLLDLFKMYQWMNYIYFFFGYMIIMLLSKWITDFFAYLQKRYGGNTTPRKALVSEVKGSRLGHKNRSKI